MMNTVWFDNHELVVLHDDGVYRHLYCSKPGTVIRSFHITTWPGYLCISGDLGCFVFSRLHDMLEFFRGGVPSGYASEKLKAADILEGYSSFSPDKANEFCDEMEKEKPELRNIIENELRPSIDDGEGDFYRALTGLESHFPDYWEYNFYEYTTTFVTCLKAIAWAIRKYDEMKNESSADAELLLALNRCEELLK